jgi:hypothetical protein
LTTGLENWVRLFFDGNKNNQELRKIKAIRIIAGIWLLGLLFYIWGVSTVEYEIFPWRYVDNLHTEVKQFLKGHEDEPDTTALEKLESDRGGVPYRWFTKNVPELQSPGDAAKFTVERDGFSIQGYYTKPPKGYFIVSGAFDLDDDYNRAAVLISAKGEYIRHWRVDAAVGLAIDETRGTILSSNDLQAVPWCSDGTKEPPQLFLQQHHSIEIAPDGTYWTNFYDSFLQLDPNKKDHEGKLEIIRSISTRGELMPLNPNISLFSTHLRTIFDEEKDPEKRHPIIRFGLDPFHNNDVQPFVDERFPTSLGYALLISVRNYSLILVVDPETKKILWYRQGLTERQHDLDYFDGGIYVYDNGTFRGYSRIARIEFDDPDDGSFGIQTIIDGRKLDWFDATHGQQQVFAHAGKRHHLFINGKFGRMYLINDQGEIVFALQNHFKTPGDTNTSIQLRAALFISESQYERFERSCP